MLKEYTKRFVAKQRFRLRIIFLALISAPFCWFGIGAVYLLFDGVPQWWYMAVGGVIPFAISVLFVKLLGVKETYKLRKKISNEQFYVVKDYCDSVDTYTYESDGPTTKYIWHFLNTDSRIEVIEPNKDFVEKNTNMCEYYLVFIQGEKQPVLFYNCVDYIYKKFE